MNLVNKFDIEDRPRIIRGLNSHDSQIIQSEHLSNESQLLLKQIHESGHWLLCDCLPYSPVSVKYVRGSNRYHLQKVPYRDHHNASCHFHEHDKPNTKTPIRNAQKAAESFQFTYDYEYRKNIKSLLNESGEVLVTEKDGFTVFIKTLLDARPIELNWKKADITPDDIKTRSAQFILNGRSLRDNLFIGYLGEYLKAKDNITEQLNNNIAHPVCLYLCHAHDITDIDRGHKLTFFKEPKYPKSNSIRLPANTPICHSNLSNKAPFMVASIIGVTGRNKQTGQHYIGPIHTLLLPSMSYNSMSVMNGDFNRTFWRVLFSQSQHFSNKPRITLLNSSINTDGELIMIKSNNKTYQISFSEYKPTTGIWLNTKNQTVSSVHTELEHISDFVLGGSFSPSENLSIIERE